MLQINPVAASVAVSVSPADRGTRPRSAPHIVVLDDDPVVRTLLCRVLEESGYRATGVETGNDLAEVMRGHLIDLVILDVMLREESGFDVCSAIRARSRLPVIMISARGQEQDQATGLDLGADDYIAKPFGRAQVLARVRAVLRRTDAAYEPLDVPACEAFAFAGWDYRPQLHQLLAPNGVEVELTAAEHKMLMTLVRHPQRMISRERLLELTRTRLSHPSDRSVDMLVSRLRRKMGDGRRARPIIQTVRGIGYMFAAEVELK